MVCLFRDFVETFAWGFGAGAVVSPIVIILIGHFATKTGG